MWAISSVGRAPPLQGGGHWFETGIAHHLLKSVKLALVLFYLINKNGHKTFHFMTALLSNFWIKLALNLTLCVH